MSDRKQILYNGFTIVAANFRGKFQGRASYDLYYQEGLPRIEFRAEGATTDTVVGNLKAHVDDFNTNRHAAIERIRLANHKSFLANKAIPYQGVKTTSRLHRVTHCYLCKNGLDNSVDQECNACGWIICNCGACGCGRSA